MPLLAMLTLASLSAGLVPQQVSSFADVKLYEAVIDRLFQSETSDGTPEERLRYTYCDSGEMQVVVHHPKSGALRVEVWRLPKGSPPISEQLVTLWAEKPAMNVDEAASRIAVRRQSLSISRSSPISKALEPGRSLSIGLAGIDGIFLEASRYELTVDSISKTLTLSILGPQDWRRSADPVIRWMGRVRVAIDRAGETPQR